LKILADEGIDAPIVDRLREEGHQVIYVAELDPGVDDGTILDLARRQGALLLTFDKDFGELIFRQRRAPSGVLLLRLAGLSAHTKCELVTATLSDHAQELIGAFSVLTPGQLRLRRSGDEEID
jgi:predicted nuclease of predicted toxin-antitoxin system